MLTTFSDNNGGVDCIKLIVAVSPVGGGDMEIKTLVGRVGDNVALVFPSVVVSGIGILHHSDEGTFTPRVVAVNKTGHDNGIVHAVEIILHFHHRWSPISECVHVGVGGGKPHPFANLI